MNFQFKTLSDFLDYFKDEKTCYDFLEKNIWVDGIVCPHCGSMKQPYKVKARNGKDIPTYRCSEQLCDLPFTIKNKTVFEGTKIDLRKWFHAIYELSINKRGISSITLAEKIGVSQKTGWLMLQKIRNTNKEDKPTQLEGTIQVDEAFIGGKNKNRHHDRKAPQSQGRSHVDKRPLLGMVEEGDYPLINRPNKVHPHKMVVEKVCVRPHRLRLIPLFTTSGKEIEPILKRNIKEGSIVFTDEWLAYTSLEPYFFHYICDHSKGQYVGDSGFATTNKVESFWSLFKRGIIGTYYSVSKKHLKYYCNEFMNRFNTRHLDIVDKFLGVIDNALKPRVTYKFLTRPFPRATW